MLSVVVPANCYDPMRICLGSNDHVTVKRAESANSANTRDVTRSATRKKYASVRGRNTHLIQKRPRSASAATWRITPEGRMRHPFAGERTTRNEAEKFARLTMSEMPKGYGLNALHIGTENRRRNALAGLSTTLFAEETSKKGSAKWERIAWDGSKRTTTTTPNHLKYAGFVSVIT